MHRWARKNNKKPKLDSIKRSNQLLLSRPLALFFISKHICTSSPDNKFDFYEHILKYFIYCAWRKTPFFGFWPAKYYYNLRCVDVNRQNLWCTRIFEYCITYRAVYYTKLIETSPRNRRWLEIKKMVLRPSGYIPFTKMGKKELRRKCLYRFPIHTGNWHIRVLTTWCIRQRKKGWNVFLEASKKFKNVTIIIVSNTRFRKSWQVSYDNSFFCKIWVYNRTSVR